MKNKIDEYTDKVNNEEKKTKVRKMIHKNYDKYKRIEDTKIKSIWMLI